MSKLLKAKVFDEMLSALKGFVPDGDMPQCCDCGNVDLPREPFVRAILAIKRAELCKSESRQ